MSDLYLISNGDYNLGASFDAQSCIIIEGERNIKAAVEHFTTSTGVPRDEIVVNKLGEPVDFSE